MSKRFYKVLMSNLRASRRDGLDFGINSFPIWGDEYKLQWAAYLAHNVLGWDIAKN